jgi:hypothetical protein
VVAAHCSRNIGGRRYGRCHNTHFRSRTQPVGYQIEILPIFVGAGELGTLAPRVTFTDEEENLWGFDKLYVIQIEVDNRGNQDKTTFDFGITLLSDAKAIFVLTTTPDRHHKAKELSKASPSSPISEIDYTLEPFNRKDKYSFKLYAVTGQTFLTEQDIILSSKEPVIFTERPGVGAVTNRLANKLATEIAQIALSRYLK